MKTPRRARSGGLKFNITPLIDIVFQLIIFFLAASHLARTDAGDGVELPLASTGEQEEAEATRRFVVTVNSAGEFMVGGNRVSAEDVRAMLQAKLAQSGAAGFEVRVRTDRRAPYRTIERLLVECAQLGITQFQFAVMPE